MPENTNKNLLYYSLAAILIMFFLAFYNLKFRPPKKEEAKPMFFMPEIKVDFNLLEKVKNLMPVENLSLPETKGKDNPFSQ
jgi:hypothetical protein